MKNRHFFNTYLLIIAMLFTGNVYGQQIPFTGTDYSKVVAAGTLTDQLNTNFNTLNFLDVKSHLWSALDQNSPNNSYGKLKVKSLRSYVKMYVDHSDPNVYDPYVYRARVEVKGYTNPSNSSQFSLIYDTLTIGYQPDTVNAYQDIHMKSYYGFYRIELKVLEIYDYTCLANTTTPCPPSYAPVNFLANSTNINSMIRNFKFEAGIIFQKVDKQIPKSGGWAETLDPTVRLKAGNAVTAGDNHLTVYWEINNAPFSPLPATALYELEWQYVDDYQVSFSSANNYSSHAACTTKAIQYCYFDFTKNTTRIITDKTNYKIPLIYKSGYIVYRVRMIRPDYINFKDNVYTDWSIPSQGSLGGGLGIGTGDYYKINPHLSDRFNWNYQVSYAEEGKSKHVLGYFDGLLKDRQTVTKFGSLPDQQIVTQKYYDYQGRPGLQVLPIPVQQNALQFLPDFAYPNSSSNTFYSPADIDNITGGSALLTPLNSQSAASNYYSSSNVFYNSSNQDWKFLKALPKDEGYPLVQTKYTPEDGRVVAQGGAGEELQINKGHETKNYYLSPEQYEMNLYLGINAGKASFYEKTITRDPNKQLSFTIKDNKGKVVLSGLAGDPTNPNNTPSAPLVLPDYTPSTVAAAYTTDLFAGISPIWDGTARKTNKPFFLELDNTVTFDYSISLEDFNPCPQYYLRVPLKYKLELFDGQTLYTPVATTTLGTASVTPVTTIPSNPPSITTGNQSVTTTSLPSGKYNVNYEVSYSQADLNNMVEQFMFPAVPFVQGGGGTPPPPNCLKSKSDFYKEQLDAVTDDCDEVFGGSSATGPCALKTELLLSELYPMAKYGKFKTDDQTGIVYGPWGSMFAIVGFNGAVDNGIGSGNPTHDNYSYITSYLTPTAGQPYYRYQAYFDEMISNGTYNSSNPLPVPPDLSTIPIQEFIDGFNATTANFYLKMHPEYCELEKQYCDNSNYIESLMEMDYATAAANSRNTLDLIVNNDPFNTHVVPISVGSLFQDLSNVRVKEEVTAGQPLVDAVKRIDRVAYKQLFCSEDPQCSIDVDNMSKTDIANDIASVGDVNVQNEYYQKLINTYKANRADLIERYAKRASAPTCSTIANRLPVVIGNALIDGYGASGAGTPSYVDNPPSTTDQQDLVDLLSGTTGKTDIENKLSGTDYSGYEEYADEIIKRLNNCRTASGSMQVLWSTVKSALLDSMNANINPPSIWKGNLTPSVLKNTLVDKGIALDDLCNPYLVDYLQDLNAQRASCNSDDYYEDMASLFNANTGVRTVVMNAAAGGITATGTITIQNTTTYPFQKALFDKFGTTSINFKVKYIDFGLLNVKHLYCYFYTGAFSYHKSVTLVLKFANSTLDLTDFSYGTVTSIDPPHTQLPLYGTFVFGCNKNKRITTWESIEFTVLGDPIAYSQGGQPLPGSISGSFTALLKGLDQEQLPEQQSCLTCLEMKKAFAAFKTEVMENTNNYNIKGNKHPFWEDAIRSFFNFYFAKNHSSEDYLKFINSCNLTQYFQIPEYYGYLYVNTGISNTASEAATDAIDNYFRVVHPDLANYSNFYYLAKDGSNNTTSTHLYVDFRSFKKPELRNIIESLTTYINNNSSTNGGKVNVYYNTLEKELPNSQQNFGDVFAHVVPGLTDFDPYNGPGSTVGTPAPNQSTNNWIPNACAVNFCNPQGTPTTDVTLNTFNNIVVKNNGTPHLFRRYHYDLATINPTEEKLALLTYRFQQMLPDDGWSFVQFNQYVTHLNSANISSAKKDYLAYLYAKDSQYPADVNDWTVSEKAQLIKDLEPAQLRNKINVIDYTSDPNFSNQVTLPTNPPSTHTYANNYYNYPYVSYYNPNKSLVSGDLFLLRSGSATGLSAISAVLNHVASNASSAFPTTPYTNSNFGSETIKVKCLADNVVWYHMKDNTTSQHRNIYVKFPASIPTSTLPLYNNVSGLEIVPASSKVRRFKMTVQRSGYPSVVVHGKTDFDLTTPEATVYDYLMLCDDLNAEADTIGTCYERQLAAAEQSAEDLYRKYIDSMREDIKNRFVKHIKAKIDGTLTATYQQNKYQVTVYEYDRAGNLVTTVPPMGAGKLINSSYQADVNAHRNNPTTGGTPLNPNMIPGRAKLTDYYYNSDNTLYYQKTPDAGTTNFYYDQAGRLIFSQNYQQAQGNRFSYTLYDDQNRVIETGEIIKTTNFYNNYIDKLRQFDFSTVTMAAIRSNIKNLTRYDVIHTFYDQELLDISQEPGMSRQDFLRGRVATSAQYAVVAQGQDAGAGYDIALHYSYDVSGNVKTLTYDVPSLNSVKQRYKRIDYDYDVMSGKVTMLSYNRSFADQFYQRYTYDDDNRVTRVETSKDGLLWDKDAIYKYYPHGPLARIDLGDLKVQGVDYAYTLQGWLKSINGDTPDPDYDMGKDGAATAPGVTMTDLHRSSLYYFNGDYEPIDGTVSATNTNNTWQVPEVAAASSLYNGNITAAVSIPGYFPSLHTSYTYDQLNRLKDAKYKLPLYDLSNNTTTLAELSQPPISGLASGQSGVTANDMYRSTYTYDADGNIALLKRFGLQVQTPTSPYNTSVHAYGGGTTYLMDDLTYTYQTATNKLTDFRDAANHSSGFSNDLKYHNVLGPVARMSYDRIGNLTADQSNDLDQINWNVYGKTTDIFKKTGSTTTDRLSFSYDPLNNRFSKTFRNNTALEIDKEYYYRDVSGNILAVYRHHHKFHYATLVPILQLVAPSAGFGSDLTSSSVATGQFVNALLGSISTGSTSFAASITNHNLGYYLQRSTNLIGQLFTGNGELVTDFHQADNSNLIGGLSQQIDRDFFGPLIYAQSLGENPELEGIASKEGILDLLVSEEDTETRLEIAANASLDEGTEDKEKFIEFFTEYINTHDPEDVYNVLESSMSTSALEYAVSTMLSNSEYLNYNYDGYPFETVLSYLQQHIHGIIAPSTLISYLNGREDAPALLTSVTTLPDRLSITYWDNPSDFITSFKVVPDALEMMSGALTTSGATPSSLITALIKADPNNQTYGQLSLGTYIDEEYFYLAEHHMYGSSRLGLKTYWPSQYLYQWNVANTAGQNQALLDASAFNYRRPWYSWKYNDLINAVDLEPYGHNSVMPIYSERLLGQKRYELTNHLGNVMGVVTDKITETPASGGTPGVAGLTANKRASLHAAYDYYPFGMLMPNRYIEDNTIQCTPQTVTHFVKVPNTVEDVHFGNATALDRFSINDGVLSGEEAVYESDEQGGGYIRLSLKEGTEVTDNGVEVASLTFTDIASGREYEFETAIVSEEQTLVMVRVTQQGDEGEVVLGSYDVPSEATAAIRVVALNDEPLKVYYRTTGFGVIRIGSAKLSTIDVVNASYVTVICNNQFNFGKDYRFGFNGMHKDNEIKGIGNSLDFGARMYDSRLGKWLSLDPLQAKYPSLSPYNFSVNNPIFFVDKDGRDKHSYYTVLTDEGSVQLYVMTPNEVEWKTFTIGSHTAASHFDIIENYTLDLRSSNKSDQKFTYDRSLGKQLDFEEGNRQRNQMRGAFLSKLDKIFGKGNESPYKDFKRELSTDHGILWTSSNGQGWEQKKGNIDAIENLDDILNVIGNYGGSGQSWAPEILDNFGKTVDLIHNAIDANGNHDEINEGYRDRGDFTQCESCGRYKGSDGHSIDDTSGRGITPENTTTKPLQEFHQ